MESAYHSLCYPSLVLGDYMHRMPVKALLVLFLFLLPICASPIPAHAETSQEANPVLLADISWLQPLVQDGTDGSNPWQRFALAIGSTLLVIIVVRVTLSFRLEENL
jgi:hypothetical protein